MSTTHRFIVVLAAAAVVPVASADSWLPPKTEHYKSANGKHAFKTEPSKGDFFGGGTGTLATDKVVVWEGKLVNTPFKAFVADDGKHVVTIDTYASLGYKHSLVIYDAKGKVVADHELEKIFTKEEIARHVRTTAGSRWWSGDANFSFDAKQDHFLITMKWGKQMRISLTSGKVEAVAAP